MNLKLVNKNALKRSPDWNSSGSKERPSLALVRICCLRKSPVHVVSTPLSDIATTWQASLKVWQFHVGSAAWFLLSLALHV